MMKTILSFVNYSRIGLNRMCYSCRTKNYGSDYTLLSARGKSVTPNVFIKNAFSNFSNDGNDSEKSKDAVSGEIGGSVTQSGKYELFKDENAPLILDVIEERQRIQELDETEEDDYDEFSGINLERGLTGVFDLEDLIFLLQRENAKDIFVASIPPHLQYVDYIVVVTGRSLKHMVALAEFIRRVYKKKRHGGDLIPKIEGETSKDWLAIDLGNIALHILSSSARPIYDIESLWSVGKEFDEKSNSSADVLNELLRKHEISLDDFQPADTLR